MTQARIWNRFAKGYARRPVGDPESYARKLELTAARLTPDMRMLEVGCGTGTTALAHAHRVAQIDAIDFSDAMIAIARDKAKAQGIENVNFRVADLTKLPRDGRYDAVSAQSVLHLLPDPGQAVVELAAQLRPGGLLFTSTTCIRDLGGVLPRILPWLSWTRLIPSVFPLSKSDVEGFHHAAGLEILDVFQPSPRSAVFITAKRPVE